LWAPYESRNMFAKKQEFSILQCGGKRSWLSSAALQIAILTCSLPGNEKGPQRNPSRSRIPLLPRLLMNAEERKASGGIRQLKDASRYRPLAVQHFATAAAQERHDLSHVALRHAQLSQDALEEPNK